MGRRLVVFGTLDARGFQEGCEGVSEVILAEDSGARDRRTSASE
jgi:hypothetical protein